jgi:hypothetical protein
MKTLPILLAALSAIGCSASFNAKAMESRQWGGEKVFTDADLQKIEQLRPQLAIPFRLAVAPPLYGELWAAGELDGERDALRAWGDALKATGIVSEVIVLPRMLIGASVGGRPAQDYFKAVRIAAARVQADAVLLLSSVTDTSSYVNPLCILDAAVIGLYLAPGHHTAALTLVEGIVMDNRNEYLYWIGSTQGRGSTTGPALMLHAEDAVRESRTAALKAFGEALIRDAQAFKPGPPGTKYPTQGR